MQINYSGMFDITEVLEKFKKENDFDRTIRLNTLFKFWKQVVGKKFENNSRCETLNESGVLTVACQNSLVCNELFMFKDELIRKTNIYANPLDLNVRDIVFSHKIWKEIKPQSDEKTEEPPKEQPITEKEINEIEIEPSELEEIKSSIENINFANNKQKEKMFSAIVKNLKIQKIKAKKIR